MRVYRGNPYTKTDPVERFWSLANPCGEQECWLWSGWVTAQGYGYIAIDGVGIGAHRFSFYLAHGRYPPTGWLVRHTCDVRLCVNPAHLVEGTHADNMRDAVERKRMSQGDQHWMRLRPDEVAKKILPTLKPPHGEDHHSHRLTESDVKEIRRLFDCGDASFTDLARRYGVTDATIGKAAHRQTWKHVPDTERT